MAVQIFKDGEVTYVTPKALQAHRDAGWTLEPTPTKEEADTNDSGKLSVDEVRVAAKAAGIRNWHNKKIATLKKELGYEG